MKMIILLLFISFFANYFFKQNYAVLVAGSKGWGNYRHQSNIYHLYSILLQFGWDPNNIITMTFDDIAYSPHNPFPGKIFNKPDGPDVYSSFKADYTNYNVSYDTFINVCLGNKTAMKGIGTERVLESTSEDNVIIFFADHGGDNCIAFPRKTMGQGKLNKMLKNMKELKKFNKLLFYVEACHSGSLFNDTKLDPELNIWITTSANNSESSHSTYCNEEAVINNTLMGTCLGGEYATCFLEKLESTSLSMTLEQQFEYIKECTLNSHPSNYGWKERSEDSLYEFFKGDNYYVDYSINVDLSVPESKKKYGVYDEKETFLQSLKFLSEKGGEEDKKIYEKAIRKEKRSKYVFEEFRKMFSMGEKRESEDIDFDCYEELIEFYEKEENCQLDIDIDIYRFTYLANFCTLKLSPNLAKEALKNLCANSLIY